MGFFAGLNEEKYDRKYTDRQLTARIITYFRPHIVRVVTVVLMLLLVSGTDALQPVVVSRGLDQIGTKMELKSIYLIAAIILMVGVFNWFANWARRRLTVRVIADVLMKLAQDAFAAAAAHDLSFYDEFSSGKIASRITSDTQAFGELVGLITDVGSQVLESIILAVILFTIDWRLTLLAMTLIPLIFTMTLLYRNLARKVTRQGMRAMADVNSTIKETVSGIAVAKNFRQELGIFEIFNKANLASYKVNINRGLVLSLVFPTLNTIAGVATALMVYAGGLSVSQGIVTAGSWYLFILSLDRFMFPVMSLASFTANIQNGLSSAERVFALIDADPVVVQTADHVPPPLRGEIAFKHLNFHYKDTEPVLSDFNLHIQPGETVALVGHTGAGKSSIAKLIARFYEYQQGEILIDGLDIRSLNLESYRRQLGIVSQVPFLFSGTVLENICYTCSQIHPKAVEQVAHQIGDGEWLETLSNGLYTEVGERGARLSMGQRQLVSLMRVLVQRPALFILDEATASIDPFTEWQIQQALNLILKQTTSILIAHRLSTVRSADRIIVMREGSIIEEGSHDNLMGQNGHYAELYNTYFRHQSLAYVESAQWKG
ncbi:MAG: ABC transporter ATP-binding protein [Chloroflexi bacterium HGW-Chloroflexi-10]|nr:MAG: ABC transporter ATP-binding protein [Chloroflexi bacterium HGW-Chloroflexi-10]